MTDITALLAEIEAGLEGVADETWEAEGSIPASGAHCYWLRSGQENFGAVFGTGDQQEAIAAHITRLHPGNVRLILDHIRAQAAEIERLREALRTARPYVEIAEFLESRAFSYGGGSPVSGPAEWGISVGYQETIDGGPYDHFADDVAKFHADNLDDDDGSGEFLTEANRIRAALNREGPEHG